MIRVMIVEDDPMVAEINKTFLLRIPEFTLAGMAGNGTEAMAFLAAHPGRVDLILLDVFMPQMDGMDFLKKIKQEYPLIDIIMVTAAQSSDKIKMALSRGVVDYIIKPFTFERMAMALKSYYSRWCILNNAGSSIGQAVLDKKIFLQNGPVGAELPKGIEKQTLLVVKETAARQGKPFSTQELSEHVGISRISLRKYLSYLEDEGILSSTLVYRSKGRPIQMYEYVKK